MSIFQKIKTAIFGPAKAAPSAPATPRNTVPAAPVTSTAAPAAGSAVAPPPAPVDIEAVMRSYESKTEQKLNWRTSIVDLLKLLDIDSSLDNRKELAKELGYTGSTSDSAAMNIWLHKQVLLRLRESGGTVPASLID